MDPTIEFQPAVRAHVGKHIFYLAHSSAKQASDSTLGAIEAVIRTLHKEDAPKMLAKRWTYLKSVMLQFSF
jgi:hypothetical protein